MNAVREIIDREPDRQTDRKHDQIADAHYSTRPSNGFTVIISYSPRSAC